MGERINGDVVVNFLDEWAYHWGATAREQFSGMWRDHEDLDEAWHQTYSIIRAIKDHDNLSSPINVIMDLNVADIIWLSVAERSLSRQIAKPGEYGPLLAKAHRRSGVYHIVSLVGAHTGELAKSDIFSTLSDVDIYIVSSLDFGAQEPIRFMVVNQQELKIGVMLTAQLNELRSQAFLKSSV